MYIYIYIYLCVCVCMCMYMFLYRSHDMVFTSLNSINRVVLVKDNAFVYFKTGRCFAVLLPVTRSPFSSASTVTEAAAVSRTKP